jgi:putative transposase
MKEFYRRNLPHYQPNDAVLFITARLHDSIPKEKILTLKEAREVEVARLKRLGLSKEELKEALRKNEDLYFDKFEDYLDGTKKGVHWFREDSIAQIWML